MNASRFNVDRDPLFHENAAITPPDTLLGNTSAEAESSDWGEPSESSSPKFRPLQVTNLANLHRSVEGPPWEFRPLEESDLHETYNSAERRLFLFDYDGTLTKIVENPADAVIPAEGLKWLATLASEPRNTVWVISGRDQTFLQQRLGHLDDIGLVSEHGAFGRLPRRKEWECFYSPADMSWWPKVFEAFQRIVAIFPGCRIEIKKVAIVLHYRMVSPPELAALVVAECQKELDRSLPSKWPVGILTGKCVIEARPLTVSKGLAVEKILHEAMPALVGVLDFVLCAGDDVTDEGTYIIAGGSECILTSKFRYVLRSSPFQA